MHDFVEGLDRRDGDACSCTTCPQVEHHNRQIQQSFSQQMDRAFGNMQRCIQQQEARHQHVLSGYSHAISKAKNKTGRLC